MIYYCHHNVVCLSVCLCVTHCALWLNDTSYSKQKLCAKNYENCLPVDKVIAKIVRLTFWAHPVYSGV